MKLANAKLTGTETGPPPVSAARTRAGLAAPVLTTGGLAVPVLTTGGVGSPRSDGWPALSRRPAVSSGGGLAVGIF
jgi:hypothetical protein